MISRWMRENDSAITHTSYGKWLGGVVNPVSWRSALCEASVDATMAIHAWVLGPHTTERLANAAQGILHKSSYPGGVINAPHHMDYGGELRVCRGVRVHRESMGWSSFSLFLVWVGYVWRSLSLWHHAWFRANDTKAMWPSEWINEEQFPSWESSHNRSNWLDLLSRSQGYNDSVSLPLFLLRYKSTRMKFDIAVNIANERTPKE